MRPETVARIKALEDYAEERYRAALTAPFEHVQEELCREALAGYARMFELHQEDAEECRGAEPSVRGAEARSPRDADSATANPANANPSGRKA